MADREHILFLCTHNSARSQIAEGLLRALADNRYEVHSAGTVATHVRPEAIRVMAEIGIDISHQKSKTLDRYLKQNFDWVITVCDDAAESCPAFPGWARRLHWPLPDPSQATGTDEDRLNEFRRVRDRLRHNIVAFIGTQGTD
jgi:arsenate reductase